jgi:hypothetical protein
VRKPDFEDLLGFSCKFLTSVELTEVVLFLKCSSIGEPMMDVVIFFKELEALTTTLSPQP